MNPTALDNLHPALRRAWHPVALSSEVSTAPHAARLLGESWVLARLPRVDDPGATTLAAFRDRCPHRFAPLSAGRVRGSVLQCGYHGWCFAADGSCTDIPALGSDRRLARAAATTPAAVTEHLGIVFVALEPPLTDLMPVPAADDPAFLRVELVPSRARASAGLLIDNFLDMAHFPFVHAATIGTEEAVVTPEIDVERGDLSLRATSEHVYPNRQDAAVASGERPLLQRRRLTYELRAPFSATLRIDELDAARTHVIGFFVQPEDHDRCRVYTVLWRDDADGDVERLSEAANYEQRVLDEDLALQSRFERLELPLDLSAELHTKADRVTVELRRTLAELVRRATG